MRRDAQTNPRGNRQFAATPRRRGTAGGIALALVLCLALPLAQTATAAEIYARAIGDEYLPAKPPATASPQTPATTVPDLPGLGTGENATEARTEGMSMWSKVLIGIVVVGAAAALGGRGEGSVTADASSASSPPPASAPAPTPAPTTPSPPPPTGGTGGGGL
ncbi:MAG: hypothetical protein ACJ8J7_00375, partial [Sulfurifustaceae bacterium]